LEIAPFDRTHYDFLLAFHSNYVPIARYWSKIANLNLPHLYFAPPFILSIIGDFRPISRVRVVRVEDS